MLEKQTNLQTDANTIKLYTSTGILVATFIGGPLAAGYLVRQNSAILNRPQEAKNAMLIGLAATVFIFSVVLLTPDRILDRVPNAIIPSLYVVATYYIVENIHGNILANHKEQGGHFHSVWRAAGIGVLALIATLAIIFVLYFVWFYLMA